MKNKICKNNSKRRGAGWALDWLSSHCTSLSKCFSAVDEESDSEQFRANIDADFNNPGCSDNSIRKSR